jgi:hypothetical protein
MIVYYNKFRRDLIINEYKKKFETEEEIKALYNLGKLEFHDALHDLVESVAIKIATEKTLSE